MACNVKDTFITEEDLPVINDVLKTGADVKIKRTKNGVKILKEAPKVVRTKDFSCFEK